MSYERKNEEKIKGDSLDAFVTNLSNLFSTQMTIRNTEEEFKFNSAVMNDGLSLDDQLEFRKEQFKKVKDDPTERKRVQGEINSLKQRIEQKEFSDNYLSKLLEYSSGLSSIDSVIDYLNNQKASATDQTIIDAINKELLTKNSEKFNLTTKLISNQTEYATNDKSVEIIDNQISKVTSEKSKALIAGNSTLASSYDLQLQALNKAKTEASIERDITNFATITATGYSTAVGLLDAYNTKISQASSSSPVTIGGITYSSAQEFWTFKRDSYVADQSTSGLFGRLSNEVDTKIKTASSKNILDVSLVQNYTNEVSSLIGRPELAGYENKIDSTKQSLVQTGADFLADNIVNRYAVDLDLNKAIGNLNALKLIGVNVENAYTKIITAGASVKSGQIDSILSAAQTALQNDPNLKPEDAINMAISSGASIVKSPEELATTSEKKLATDLSKTSMEGKGTVQEKLTVQPTTYPGGVAPDDPTNKYNYQTGQINPNYKPPETTAQTNKTSVTTPPPAPVVAPTPVAPKTTYSGVSIVDYLGTVGQDSSFANRTKLAASKGITNYTGTANQNTQLLKALRGF